MQRVVEILGRASDDVMAERLHELDHRGLLETVTMSRADMSRRRQRVFTSRGEELVLLLDRDAVIEHGSVLVLDEDRAVTVALDKPRWLKLQATVAAHALELGYFAGNMHWKVHFEGSLLWVALDGPRDDYLQRLSHLVESGAVSVVPDDELAEDAVGIHEIPLPPDRHPHVHRHG